MQSDMKEQLWVLDQRTGILLDLSHDMQWNDEAARNIRTTTLNPLEADSKSMLDAYHNQDSALDTARLHIDKAISQMKQAYETGKDMSRHHQQFTEEMDRTEQELEQAHKQEVRARLQLPKIQQLIAKAYQAGD